MSKLLTRSASALILLLGLLGLLGLAATPVWSDEGGSLYDELYPHYVEACGLTQIQRIGAKPGGPGGHAVLYLKGVCRDLASPYPRLRMCAEGEKDLRDPDSGVGVSVNKIFRNVNWIAVDGKSFFYDGGLAPGERVTPAAIEGVIARVVDDGVLRGVKIHDRYLADRPEGESYEAYVARRGAGTDFALRLGRSLQCVRVPATAAMVSRAVNYLNGLNERYFRDENYDWSMIFDNCSHTTNNALAAMGVSNPMKVNRRWWTQLFDLAAPSNLVINLARHLQNGGLDDASRVWWHRPNRRALLEDGWLPLAPGALAWAEPMIAENDVYARAEAMTVIELPLVKLRSRQRDRIWSRERSTELEANLEHALTKHRRALRRRASAREYGEMDERLRGDAEFAAFLDRYHEALARGASEIELQLARVRAERRGE